MGMVLYLRRVEGRIPDDPDEFYETYMFSEEARKIGDLIDFDKAWHGVHFLLTGSTLATDSPLRLLCGMGRPFGEDNGSSRPRLVSASEMSAFNDALAALSDAELAKRFDPEAMIAADVYLADVFAEEFGWDYVSKGIPSLRRFAQRCAERGSEAIVLIR